MNEILQFWGSIAGIVGLVVAILALLRDTFDVKLEWSTSASYAKRLVVNRRFQIFIAALLLGFSFWSLYNRIQTLTKDIENKDAEIASVRSTQQTSSTMTSNDATTVALSVATQTAQERFINELSTTATASSNRGYHVLIDMRHNTYDLSKIFNDLHIPNTQFIVSESSEFSLSRLKFYDTVVIDFSRYPIQGEQPFEQFTTGDINALRSYVSNGGSLFLIGIGWVWAAGENSQQPISQFPLNLLAQDSGIFFKEYGFFSSDVDKEPILHNSSTMSQDHPITQGLGVISISKGANPGILQVDLPANRVVWVGNNILGTDGTKDPVVIAASTIGKGKIVCISHPDYLVNSKQDNTDNAKMIGNVIKWLTNHSLR